MTEKSDLVGLLNSHQIRCRGLNREGRPVLPEEKAIEVIVKVYKDGKTEPLCIYLGSRYLSGSHKDKCKLADSELGFCLCVYKTSS